MRYLRAYWPVLLWMAVIFAASTDLGSSERSSRFIGPVLRWFVPDISEEGIHQVQFVVRKTAHVVVYAVLAVLIWFSRRRFEGDYRKWSWREAWLFILPITCLYAISDEFHQGFVATRQASAGDVVLDTAGGLLGLVLVWLGGKWRQIW